MRSTISRRVFRGVAGAAVTGLVLATASACSVPPDAVAGVSVTEDGHLLGVIQVCGHHIDGAVLYYDEEADDLLDDVVGTKSVTVNSWTADRPLEPGLFTWPLESPAAGWTAEHATTPLSAEITYTFFGGTEDSSWSAQSVEFTLADRDRLTPGMVRYFNANGPTGDEPTVTVPMAEFKAGACATLRP